MRKLTFEEFLHLPGKYESYLGRMRPTPHPVIGLPSLEQILKVCHYARSRNISPEHTLQNWFKKREELIDNERSDPYFHGYRPQTWKDALELLKDKDDILLSGPNRSSKSHFCAWLVIDTLLMKPGSIVWCLTETSMMSVRDQQTMVWHYLPFAWKKTRREKLAYINYRKQTGFSDGKFICPNGSECYFLNYAQDVGVAEGGQVDLYWGNEEIPLDWLQALRGRTADRKGKGVVDFTPVSGFIATLSDYVTGATVRTSRPVDADLLPDAVNMKLWPGLSVGRVPYILDSMDPRRGVIFFDLKANPYMDWREVKARWQSASLETRLIRLAGITSKKSGSRFPRFGKHNIIPPEAIPVEGTNYMVLDYAWDRNWPMLWARVCPHPRLKGKTLIYIYREWPDYDTYGSWAEPSDNKDGKRGPAQAEVGNGPTDYKRLIFGLEKGEEVFAHYGDKRPPKTMTEQGVATVPDLLADDSDGLPPLIIESIHGTAEQNLIVEGVNLVNQWLEYDPEKPLSDLNSPRLYVSERCRNLIDCLKLWTGGDGNRGASKDFIDLLRYLAIMDIDYVDGTMPVSTGGGSY